MEVVRIKTFQRKMMCSDTKEVFTPPWSLVDGGRARKTADPGGEIHFTVCFRRMEGSQIVASVFFISAGREGVQQRSFRTIVWWMTTRFFGQICNFWIAQRIISANTCPQTREVSRTWPRQRIKRGVPSRTWENGKCTPQCTSTKGGAILSSSWPGLSFEVVANQGLGWSCWYIPHKCGNEQQWLDRNAAQCLQFMKSLRIHHYTQRGLNRFKFYCCKSCSNDTHVQGIGWAVPGICTSCLAREQLSSTILVAEYRFWWLW